MKKLWRRATGIIKDRNSLWLTTLKRRRYLHLHHRSPELEAAIIKATSHDDTFIDYDNGRHVFTWVKTSPTHLVMFLWALTRRVDRTRDWVVALKSLILFHGVLCTKVPGVHGIGRLPFDLSAFEDTYTQRGSRRWSRAGFVRAYFAFLDAKSVSLTTKEGGDGGEQDDHQYLLVKVQLWQDLLDAVLKVRPWGVGTTNVLILEAMDGMIIEVFDLYSKICDGIAKSLMKIYAEKSGKVEAALALNVLKKATRQGEELEEYFKFCVQIGMLDEIEIPKIEKIPDGDFVELERIIRAAREVESSSSSSWSSEADNEDQRKSEKGMKTVVTELWEIFDEDIISKDEDDDDPFAASLNYPPLIQFSPLIDYGCTPAGSQLLISL